MFINREKLDDRTWAWGKHVLVEYKTQDPEQTLQYFNYSENDSGEFTFIFNLSSCSDYLLLDKLLNLLVVGKPGVYEYVNSLMFYYLLFSLAGEFLLFIITESFFLLFVSRTLINYLNWFIILFILFYKL